MKKYKKKEITRNKNPSHQTKIKIYNAYTNQQDPSLENWFPVADSPDNDILSCLEELRAKSRDLFANNDLAGAALKKMRTKIVGTGLIPKPSINWRAAGITKEKAKECERIIKTKFNAWATSTNADFQRMHDFYTLQGLVQLSWVMNGDTFVIPRRKKRTGVEIDLCLQLLEADRIMNPPGANKNIHDGVELSNEGDVIKYYISDKHPGDGFVNVKGYPAFNSLGKRNILHIFEPDRISQMRGIPILAGIIYSVKTLGRYKNAELIAAVLNASIGLIVEARDPEGFINQSFGTEDATEKKERTDKIDLDHGIGIIAKDGETVKEFNTTRPNKSFKEFVDAIYQEAGAQLEIPREVLMSSFQASYSASKAAIEEAHQRFLVCRKLLERKLCQPVYEDFVLELIKNGDIDCPNFFSDSTVRYAFTRAIWVGAGKPSLDPLKEANANAKNLENYTTTRAIIAAEAGLDFEEILEDRKEEEIAIANVKKDIEGIIGEDDA